MKYRKRLFWLVVIATLCVLILMATTQDTHATNTTAPQAQQVAGPDERVCYPQDMDTQAGTYTLKDRDNEVFTVGRTNDNGTNSRLVLIKDCKIITRFADSYGAASITWEHGYPVITSVSEGKRQGLRYRIDERYEFDYVPPMFGVAALPVVLQAQPNSLVAQP